MTARGGRWPGNAEVCHVSFSMVHLAVDQHWSLGLIIPRKSTSTDEESVAEMEILCLSSTSVSIFIWAIGINQIVRFNILYRWHSTLRWDFHKNLNLRLVLTWNVARWMKNGLKILLVMYLERKSLTGTRQVPTLSNNITWAPTMILLDTCIAQQLE